MFHFSVISFFSLTYSVTIYFPALIERLRSAAERRSPRLESFSKYSDSSKQSTELLNESQDPAQVSQKNTHSDILSISLINRYKFMLL